MADMEIHHLSDHATKVRCRNCTQRKGVQKGCLQVCRQCENTLRLCSDECFNQYHIEHSFEMIAAPVKKPGGNTQCDISKDPSVHYVVHKPPTERNPKPRGKCRLCTLNGDCKETYYQCNYCCIPFCDQQHLMEHHRRMQILDIP